MHIALSERPIVSIRPTASQDERYPGTRKKSNFIARKHIHRPHSQVTLLRLKQPIQAGSPEMGDDVFHTFHSRLNLHVEVSPKVEIISLYELNAIFKGLVHARHLAGRVGTSKCIQIRHGRNARLSAFLSLLASVVKVIGSDFDYDLSQIFL